MPLNLSAIEEFFDSVPVLNRWASEIESDLVKLRESKADKTVQKTQGDLATIDQVDTPEVVDSAINEDGLFSNDGVINTTDGTEIEIGTVTVSVNTDVVEVFGKCIFTLSFAGTTRIRKDSTSGAILDQSVTTPTVPRTDTLIGLDTSPAATQTYKLTLQRQTGTNVGASVRRMVVGNRKK